VVARHRTWMVLFSSFAYSFILHLGQFSIKRSAIDTEHAGGLGVVAAGLIKNLANILLFDLFKCLCPLNEIGANPCAAPYLLNCRW